MTVDHVFDWDVEALGQLAFKPGGKLGADRLDQDDALGRDHERRNIIVHSRVIDVGR